MGSLFPNKNIEEKDKISRSLYFKIDPIDKIRYFVPIRTGR